jgi:glucose-1-phosphate adenylyltransferase
MLVAHVESGAEMTVSCLEVPVEEAAGAFGVMKVDENLRVVGFEEKPDHPSEIPGQPGQTLASMGNYIFNTDFLFEQLQIDAADKNSTRDFGNDIIPKVVEEHHILAYPFRDMETGERAYWRDVGTLDSFWEANMELVSTSPALNMYDPEWPIWTAQTQLPPAKFVFNSDERRGMAVDSLVSGGCIISGAHVCRSILFSEVRVNSYSDVDHTVILPKAVVGRNCKIKNAIIDRGVEVPDDMVIGYDVEQDKKNGFRVSEKGIVLVTRGMLGQPEGFA